jgi:hypothetical protein
MHRLKNAAFAMKTAGSNVVIKAEIAIIRNSADRRIA